MPNKIVPGNKPGHHIAIHMPNPNHVHVVEIPSNKNKKNSVKTRKNRKSRKYNKSRKNRK